MNDPIHAMTQVPLWRKPSVVWVLVGVSVWLGWSAASFKTQEVGSAEAESALSAVQQANSVHRSDPANTLHAGPLVSGLSDAVNLEGKQRDALLALRIEELKSLIQKARDYKQRAERLLAENPELQKLPSLIRDLEGMPDAVGAVGRQQWRQMAEASQEAGDTLFKILHLLKPSVMLAMLEDAAYGEMIWEAYEIAGMKNGVDSDLAALDQLAGIRDGLPPSVDAARFRQELERRERAYAEVAGELAATLPQPLTDDLKRFMFAEMQRRTQIPYLRAYYDSFFMGELLELAEAIQNERKALQLHLPNLELPVDLLSELDALIRFAPPLPRL